MTTQNSYPSRKKKQDDDFPYTVMGSQARLEERVAKLEHDVDNHRAQLEGLNKLAPLVDRVSQILRHFGVVE